MDNQLLDESFVEAKEMGELASFGQRLGAVFIDGFLFISILLISFYSVGLMSYFELIFNRDVEGIEKIDAENMLYRIYIITGFSMIARWLYYALLESSSKQGTLGKMALNIIVTDINGEKLTFGKSSIRYWTRVLPTYIPFGIGFLYALVDGFSQLGTSKKQTIHDIVAGTLVYNK